MMVDSRFGQLCTICRRGIVVATVLMVAFCLVAPFAGAQSTGGRIRGTVMDASGGAVPAATVTLINQGTHATREIQSGGSGDDILIEVPVGTHESDTVRPGLQKYNLQRNVLHLQENIS